MAKCKLTGNTLMIIDHVNKGYADEKFNCKYYDSGSREYKYIWKNRQELEGFSKAKVGFNKQ
jgi:hypothetical protein